MSRQATGLRVASLVFGLVAILHIWRLIAHAQVVIGTTQIPMWVSALGLIVAGTLSIWMWRLSSARLNRF